MEKGLKNATPCPLSILLNHSIIIIKTNSSRSIGKSDLKKHFALISYLFSKFLSLAEFLVCMGA